MFWGAVSGAVTCGIGNLFSVAKEGVAGGMELTKLAKALGSTIDAAGKISMGTGAVFVGAACHAVAQGALSMMQGGKFFSGAAAGFLGHLGGAAWGEIGGNFASSDVGAIGFGALSGGVGAELTGGNFWQGAVTGGIVAGLNGALHKMDSNNMFDDDDNQSGNEVTKQSLGIKKGDTPEVMISKMMKGMKVGDYMDGSQLDFLNKDAGILIDKIYRTSGTTFKVDRTLIAGRAALNDQASLTIVKGTLQKMDGYNYKINGFRSKAISDKIVTNGFINDNKAYYYSNNKLIPVPIIK